MDLTTILLFCLLVLITHFLEGVTGFGCTAMALPFAIILLGVKSAVPVLAVLAWILALVVIIIDFKKIIWKQYEKRKESNRRSWPVHWRFPDRQLVL